MATKETLLGTKLKQAGWGGDNHALRTLAVTLLKKNGTDPSKCLGKFVELISKPGSELIIALIGKDEVRRQARVYLGEIANELNPGAHTSSESHTPIGAGNGEAQLSLESQTGTGLPVPITTADGAQRTDESQLGHGPMAAGGAAQSTRERQTSVGRTVPLPAPKPPRVTSDARVAVRKLAPLSAFDYKIRGMHRSIGNLRIFEILPLIAHNHMDSMLLGMLRAHIANQNDRNALIKQVITAAELAKMIKRAKEAAYVAA